ncbi:MAG: SMP-30/gluconolactonase/LRE family protein [Phyllobacterium sp.]|uniref:SMP-30/gluconolactonase/LRE family protein n=1 Tax=Phyllobacterium sp. TaxID=1871046 RepID=UPI0030F32403
MQPLLPLSKARVFFDGIFTEPRVAHPEGVAVHVDGSIWCGTETGDLLRIDAKGNSVERMASTGGFLLGIAFDSAGNCIACDLRHKAIFRFDAATKEMARFADAGIKVPNFPVLDEENGWLYVSDSAGDAGSVFRFDLKTGAGGPWCRETLAFANGMAITADGRGLFVVESDAACVSLLGIDVDGSPTQRRVVIEGVHNVPDGLALMPDGSLLISCYEPSRIYTWCANRGLRLLIEDPTATTLAHPTNVALKGSTLYTANLGRWHITEIDIGSASS